MKNISYHSNPLKRTIKKITPKKILISLGIICLMSIGAFIGYVLYEILGSGFGLALGYVLGRLIIGVKA